MLTIDWKDRLNKDTAEFLEKKLPKNDYDFEIIFIAYPERVNGKIPPEVIIHVANTIVHHLGKNHDKYIPFFKHLWDKKGENGKTAFIAIMSKITGKKPAVYIPLIESAINSASMTDVAAIMEKVMLPLLRKQPEKYLAYLYSWSKSPKEIVRKQTIGLLVKLLKKSPELAKETVQHYVNQWLQPLGDIAADHVLLLKAVTKFDADLYLDIWHQHSHSRDPQSAEILCASIQFYHEDIAQTVDLWTKSGNARLKKAAVTAQRLLLKKKP